jgi:hypothetical protein
MTKAQIPVKPQASNPKGSLLEIGIWVLVIHPKSAKKIENASPITACRSALWAAVGSRAQVITASSASPAAAQQRFAKALPSRQEYWDCEDAK